MLARVFHEKLLKIRTACRKHDFVTFQTLAFISGQSDINERFRLEKLVKNLCQIGLIIVPSEAKFLIRIGFDRKWSRWTSIHCWSAWRLHNVNFLAKVQKKGKYLSTKSNKNELKHLLLFVMTIWIFIGVKEHLSIYKPYNLHTEWKKNNDLLSVEKYFVKIIMIFLRKANFTEKPKKWKSKIAYFLYCVSMNVHMVFANITPIIFEDHCYLLEVDEA